MAAIRTRRSSAPRPAFKKLMTSFQSRSASSTLSAKSTLRLIQHQWTCRSRTGGNLTCKKSLRLLVSPKATRCTQLSPASLSWDLVTRQCTWLQPPRRPDQWTWTPNSHLCRWTSVVWTWPAIRFPRESPWTKTRTWTRLRVASDKIANNELTRDYWLPNILYDRQKCEDLIATDSYFDETDMKAIDERILLGSSHLERTPKGSKWGTGECLGSICPCRSASTRPNKFWNRCAFLSFLRS